MSTRTTIRAERVSKRYRIGVRREARASAGGRLASAAGALLRRGAVEQGDLWALRDVSFRLGDGEVVGIVGRNGAGKSTLLKILSRITEPTTGRVELYGRIGSLLEVGTGFHPELTGRENVYLNGAILGMRRAEIARKFDEIVAFSEIERFIDTPVKHYSSGMYVRLAFAVAAHLEPEILVIDEVLSVGDMAFQQKCLDKINEMREQTRAIILVTHNMISVRAICSRVLLMSAGELAADGDADAVVPLYEKLVRESARTAADEDEQAGSVGRVEVREVRLLDAGGRDRREFETGEPLKVSIDYEARDEVDDAVVYAAIRRPDGFICVGSSTRLEGVPVPVLRGAGRVEVEMPELQVLPGHYVMDVIFYDRNFDYRTYFLGRRRVPFEIVSRGRDLDEKYGVFYQKQNWRVGAR